MVAAFKNIDTVPVGRIFLLLDNPRHEPFDSEAKAIEHLCEKEDIYPLARDIAKNGLNPLERLALFPVEKRKGSKGDASYHVAEGNRRICAVKLLHDPELAPAKLRKSFEKLAETWTPIINVPAAIFSDIDSVRLWLERVHNGPQGGIGRKQWSSDQKTRFDGGNKNKAAQALLDYAVSEKMLSPDDRKGKLTTVQRFISNDVFREIMGFDQSNPDDASRTRPKAEFDIIVRRFVRDLVAGEEVNSRMNKDPIIKYARGLGTLSGVTPTRIEAESLTTDSPSESAKKTRRKTPKKPEKTKHVLYQDEIFLALKNYGNGKLQSLYHSITSIELDPHTPIVAVGVWSFFETLTACAGRNKETSIDSYLSKNKMTAYGIAGDTLTLTNALQRIREYGNTTKHHPVSATFNGDQLNNDVTSLKNVILKCIEEAETKSK